MLFEIYHYILLIPNYRASDSLSTKEPAICTLRHLTSRNPCAEKARDQIADRHVIAELHSALKNFPELWVRNYFLENLDSFFSVKK